MRTFLKYAGLYLCLIVCTKFIADFFRGLLSSPDGISVESAIIVIKGIDIGHTIFFILVFPVLVFQICYSLCILKKIGFKKVMNDIVTRIDNKIKEIGK